MYTKDEIGMKLTYKDIAAMVINEVTLRESRHIMDCSYCKKYAKALAKIYYKNKVNSLHIDN